jgi:hypothetical protein
MHPVIHGIGISKAMHSVVAVTEGHNRRPREVRDAVRKRTGKQPSDEEAKAIPAHRRPSVRRTAH